MKNLLVVTLTLLMLGGTVLAQETDLPDPGMTPDSPFYFFKRISEGIGTFFTFGDLAKAERYTELATRRLAEAKALADKGKEEIIERTLARYQEQLEMAFSRTEQARNKGEKTEDVSETVAQATKKHLDVLEGVLEKVPEQAKEAIVRAREASFTGQIRALEALRGENPEKAANLNMESLQNRLEKVKEEARKGKEEGIERITNDVVALQDLLEKTGKQSPELLGKRVSEDLIEQIEDLDEIEDITEDELSRVAERIGSIKAVSMEKQKEILKSLSAVNPEKAMEVNLEMIQSRIRRAEKKAEEGEEEMVRATEEIKNRNRFGEEILQLAQELGKDTAILEELLEKTTSIHLEILNEVLEKSPEQAKEAIREAIESSERGRQKTLEALERKRAEEPLPEDIENMIEERAEEVPEETKGVMPEDNAPDAPGNSKF